MSVTLETNETGSRIHLDGAIDIATAADLKAALLAAVEAGRPLSLSLQDATYLDVTAMQLLWAAKRAAQTAGIALEPEGAIPAPVLAALRDAGIMLFTEK